MKREVCPDNYKEPNWLYQQRLVCDRVQPQRWRHRFAGAWVTLFLITIATASDQFIGGLTTLSLVTLTGWLICTVGYLKNERLSCFQEDELIADWVKNKARADSYERQWNAAEVKELEQLGTWMTNSWENAADAIAERRRAKWWSRVFWSRIFGSAYLRPTVKLPLEVSYYFCLAREAQSRIWKHERAMRDASLGNSTCE